MYADPHFRPAKDICVNLPVIVEHPSDDVQIFNLDEDFANLKVTEEEKEKQKFGDEPAWDVEDVPINICMCELCYESRLQPNRCTTPERELSRVLKINSVFGTDDEGTHDHLLPDKVFEALQVLRKREAEKTRKNVLRNAMRETDMTLCSGKSTQDRADIMRERLRRKIEQRQGGIMIKKKR